MSNTAPPGATPQGLRFRLTVTCLEAVLEATVRASFVTPETYSPEEIKDPNFRPGGCPRHPEGHLLIPASQATGATAAIPGEFAAVAGINEAVTGNPIEVELLLPKKAIVELTGAQQRERMSSLMARAFSSTERSVPRVGRNDPCTCGSGKKYKKCHGSVGGANG